MDDRAWILCTKWSGDNALKLAERAVYLLQDFGYDIELDTHRSSKHNTTQHLSDGMMVHKIGIKELFENHRGLFSVHEALMPTVACFHEACGHGGQWKNEAMKTEPLSKVLILNDLACRSSHQFYGVDRTYTVPTSQYFEQPHEIAAQYMALKMAQKFLAIVYGDDKADKLLCEYVNIRISTENEYIKVPEDYEMEIQPDGRKPFMKPTEPFTSMSQVYDQFQKTFVHQIFIPAEYNATKDSVDFVNMYIKTKNWPWKRNEIRMQINEIDDRLTQTYVLAGIWLKQHEYGRWIKQLPVFEDMKFPRDIEDIIQSTPPQPNKEDLDLEFLTKDDIDFAKAVERINTDTSFSL